jgi:hypothetical protein
MLEKGGMNAAGSLMPQVQREIMDEQRKWNTLFVTIGLKQLHLMIVCFPYKILLSIHKH